MYVINDIKLEIADHEVGTGSFLKVLIERLQNGEWEEAESRFLSLIPPDSALLELGGCVGYIACTANRLLSDPHKHVVLEANPRMIPVLINNREKNDCSFHVEQAILSNVDFAERTFYIDNRSILGSSIVKLHIDRIKDIVEVKTKTLTSLEEKYNLKFEALICDIEGGEYDLFENVFNDEILNGFKFIGVEFHWVVADAMQRSNRILRRLTDLGFGIMEFYSPQGHKQVFAVKE